MPERYDNLLIGAGPGGHAARVYTIPFHPHNIFFTVPLGSVKISNIDQAGDDLSLTEWNSKNQRSDVKIIPQRFA